MALSFEIHDSAAVRLAGTKTTMLGRVVPKRPSIRLHKSALSTRKVNS